jgi:tetratricopeptide (TPR) repeat protein
MSAQWNRSVGDARRALSVREVRDARTRGDLTLAISGYQALTELPEATWELFSEHGELLVASGSHTAAVTLLKEAVRRFPNNPALINSLGLALHGAGRFADAVQVFEVAFRIAPAIGAIAYNLGNARKEAGDLPGAMASYVKALEAGPPLPEIFNNLGLVFQETGSSGHARAAYGSALDLDAQFLPAALNLAYLHIQEREPEGAIALLDSALRFHPDSADAHWLLSHALLVHGEYERGWKEYEWRWEKMRGATYRRRDMARQWGGEDLTGRRILLYAEQGLGDAMQCARYIPMVAARGGEVVVECQPELVSLMATVEGVGSVHPREGEIPLCDIECPLMSLPGIFGTTLETIPSVIPYVHPEEGGAEKWKKWCDDGTSRPRIGVVWAGNASHRNDARRSLPSAKLAGLTAIEGVRWISVQKGSAEDVRLAVPAGVVLEYAGAHLGDLSDTAALLKQLDLVITVDTAVAHLAGAMGLPVWVLVPYAPDWRWRLEGEGTPWYPSVRLLRQPRPGDWDAVIANIRDLLQNHVFSR